MVVLFLILVALNERSIHGADIEVGVAFWAVVPVLVKTVCLVLILLRMRTGWRGYLLTMFVVALLALARGDIVGLIIGVVTTWLLWVAIAPRWESFD